MIFTDRFVYIHEPKTGGTFVTSVLYRLHQVGEHGPLWPRLKNEWRQFHTYESRFGTFVYWKNKHGTASEIPAHHSGKPILATVRNPYDLYVSEYEFGWWKRREMRPYLERVPDFAELYPHFPELSFAEYVKLADRAFAPESVSRERRAPPVGLFTRRFISYYFRAPQVVLKQLDDDYLAREQWREDLSEVHFVRTDRLNRELYAFLLSMGYPQQDIDFVLQLGKILPGGKGRTEKQRWESYYTPELREWVHQREWLLFALFPEFERATREPPPAAR